MAIAATRALTVKKKPLYVDQQQADAAKATQTATTTPNMTTQYGQDKFNGAFRSRFRNAGMRTAQQGTVRPFVKPVVKPETTVVTGPNGELPGHTPNPSLEGNNGTAAQGVDVNAQSQQLKALADQMAVARTSGDLGTLNTLTGQYAGLVQSMQKQAAAGDANVPQVTGTQQGAPTGTASKLGTQGQALGEQTGGPGTGGAGAMDNETVTPAGTAGENSVKAKYDQDVVDQTNNAVSVFTTKGRLPQAQAQALTDWIKTNNRVPTDADYGTMFGGMTMTTTDAGDLVFTDPKTGQEAFRVDSNTRAVAADWAKQYGSMSTKWQEQGQYEQRLQDMFASQAAQSGYKIEDLPETLKNEMYREAIDAMKNGQDPKDIIGDYLSYFDENPDFSLSNNQYAETAKDLHAYQGVTSPEITRENVTVGGGDTSAITNALKTATQSASGEQATQAAIAAAQKLQNPGPFTEDDINALTAGKFAQIDAQLAADISAAQNDIAMAGGSGSGTTVAQIADIRQKATDAKRAFLGEILKEKMANDQQGFIESMNTLTGISKQEGDRLLAERGQNITGTTAATEITADVGKAQAELQYKTKALFQEGGLTAAGQQIDQNLKAYDMSLTKYQTDKGFDEAGLDRDLKARIAEQGGTIEEQKLKYQQVKDSIDAAQKQVEQTDKRNAEIANLEQDAADGDRDAKFKIQGLRVEQDLQNAGFKEEHQKTLGTLIYGLLSERIQITAEMEMLLKKYQLEESLQGSETMDFIGQILGTAGTIAAAAL